MTEMMNSDEPLQGGEPVLHKWWRTVDRWSLSCAFMLLGIGLVLALAASVPLAERNGLDRFHYVQRHMVFVSLAAMLMLIVSMMPVRMVRRLGFVGFALTVIALLLLPAFGTSFGKGAVRWYSLGFASLQPSEFLKPMFCIATGWMMAAAHEEGGPPGRIMSFIAMLFVAVLLLIQPDYGQLALIFVTWCTMWYISGAPMAVLLVLAGAFVASGTFAYRLSEHFARRIDAFWETSPDPTSQLGYAMDAIKGSGFFGAGVGEGRLKWFLPDAHTDFIIAVAAEEYGLVLILAIIALFGTIILRSLIRLMRERDPFTRLAGGGIATLIGAQALINMGVAARLLPPKGMTLPFISYGGSSTIAVGIAMGLLLALSRTRPQGEITEILRARAEPARMPVS